MKLPLTPRLTSPFGRDLLLLIAGPLIWMVHFLGIYIVNALACARPASALAMQAAGLPVSSWVIIAASVAAWMAIAAAARHAARRSRRENAPDGARFRAWLTGALCVLSALAVVWQTVPVFLVAACG
ncbi:MAG TPA: hypothetical protein DIW53_09590 [Achromobacter sp.]|nr:hypothetical protein [Achromobacter sp.]